MKNKGNKKKLGIQQNSILVYYGYPQYKTD